jgi:hypothetical protein
MQHVKVWRGLAMAGWVALCVGSTDAIIGSVIQDDARAIYDFASKWQDMLAGLAAGFAAIWAAWKAYTGAHEAADKQVIATAENTRPIVLQNEEMKADAAAKERRHKTSSLIKILTISKLLKEFFPAIVKDRQRDSMAAIPFPRQTLMSAHADVGVWAVK